MWRGRISRSDGNDGAVHAGDDVNPAGLQVLELSQGFDPGRAELAAKLAPSPGGDGEATEESTGVVLP